MFDSQLVLFFVERRYWIMRLPWFLLELEGQLATNVHGWVSLHVLGLICAEFLVPTANPVGRWPGLKSMASSDSQVPTHSHSDDCKRCDSNACTPPSVDEFANGVFSPLLIYKILIQEEYDLIWKENNKKLYQHVNTEKNVLHRSFLSHLLTSLKLPEESLYKEEEEEEEEVMQCALEQWSIRQC